jgi:hypothetical protein
MIFGKDRWARELLNNLPNLRPYIYKPVYKRQLKLKAFSGAFTNRRTEPSERHDYQAMILDWAFRCHNRLDNRCTELIEFVAHFE